MDRNADGLVSREEFFLTVDHVTTKVAGPAMQALQEFSREAVAEATAFVKEIMLGQPCTGTGDVACTHAHVRRNSTE